MNSNDVIIRPIVSEKTTGMMEENKFVFRVARKANKQLVKKAIKDLFGVTAKTVNIINVRGKKKRVRADFGRTSAWKKAIITLAPGDKIEIFDVQ